MAAWLKQTFLGGSSPSSEGGGSPSIATSEHAQTHQTLVVTSNTSKTATRTANGRGGQLHPYSLKHSSCSSRDCAENRRRFSELEGKLAGLSSAKAELEKERRRAIEERDAAKQDAEQTKIKLRKAQALEREHEKEKTFLIAERDNVKREAAELELQFSRLSEREAKTESDNAQREIKQLKAQLRAKQLNEDERERERAAAIKERDYAKQQMEELGRRLSTLSSAQADRRRETSKVSVKRERDRMGVGLKTSQGEEREREMERDVAIAERDDAKQEVERIKAELAALRAKHGARQKAPVDDELGVTKFKLASLEEQHEATKRLLATKIDEVKGMQLFTTKADNVSVGEVVSLVHSLNAEIHQASAVIADSLHFSSPEKIPEQEVSQAYTAMANLLGQDIAKAIWRFGKARKEKAGQECDPSVVEYALQVAMTRVCAEIINKWAPDAEAHNYLEGVYVTIQSKESQAVAGRWRALTRAQIGGAKDPDSIVNQLLGTLVNILIVAGCSKSQVQVDDFKKQSHDYLAGIADRAVGIRTAVGESITSMDLEAYICPPGSGFSMGYMQDMYGEAGTGDTGRAIAGTTELGLLQKQQLSAAGQSETENQPVVKAKVLLASVL